MDKGKKDHLGTDFQPSGVHNNKRDPIANRHRKKVQFIDRVRALWVHTSKRDLYRIDKGKRTVVPEGAKKCPKVVKHRGEKCQKMKKFNKVAKSA